MQHPALNHRLFDVAALANEATAAVVTWVDSVAQNIPALRSRATLRCVHVLLHAYTGHQAKEKPCDKQHHSSHCELRRDAHGLCSSTLCSQKVCEILNSILNSIQAKS